MLERQDDLLMLRLRIHNLIAAREANTAEANRELQIGGWLYDHGLRDKEIAIEIETLFEKYENARQGN